MVRMMWMSFTPKLARPSSPGRGLGITSSAPACSALKDISASTAPEMTRMRLGASLMMRELASMPSMRGMRTSRVMTSGFNERASSRASAPSFAVPMTWMSGADDSSAEYIFSMVGESSAMRTRMLELMCASERGAGVVRGPSHASNSPA